MQLCARFSYKSLYQWSEVVSLPAWFKKCPTSSCSYPWYNSCTKLTAHDILFVLYGTPALNSQELCNFFFETGSPGFYTKFYNETAKQAGVTSGYENLEESSQSQNYVAIKGKYSARRPRKKNSSKIT